MDYHFYVTINMLVISGNMSCLLSNLQRFKLNSICRCDTPFHWLTVNKGKQVEGCSMQPAQRLQVDPLTLKSGSRCFKADFQIMRWLTLNSAVLALRCADGEAPLVQRCSENDSR